MRAATRLNSPENREAFSGRLSQSLRGHMQQIAQDGALRRILLTTAGAAFCAGADLKPARRTVEPSSAGCEHDIETMRRRGNRLAWDRDRLLSRH
jgi:enoyl-CoA hydratase/carnithine racemase